MSEQPLDSADALIRSSDAGTETTSSVRTQLANAMAGLMKKRYGRGPTAAKAFLEDDYLFVVLEDGLLLPHEETLLEHGMDDEVRAHRLKVQEAVEATAIGAVEEILRRKVVGYHSQITFRPTRGYEIFALEPQTRA
jgi:uncharacterized protein YbcI